MKYRPAKFVGVVGQDEVVESIKQSLAKATRPHTFLLTGPSGCGKTTLARIIAAHLECDPANILEADAATNTGIDSMRAITDMLRYSTFGARPNRMIILDECHALSKSAWQALLKSIEEPPPNVFFAFCTTDAAKVPDTIVTRCSTYTLKSVKVSDLQDLLSYVCEEEQLEVPDKIIDLVARAADGSPRKALVMLSMVSGIQDVDKAARVLETPLEQAEVIDLCRMMVSGRGFTWDRVRTVLESIKDQPAESTRIVIVSYLSTVLLKAASEKEAARLMELLYYFSKPFMVSDKMAPLLLAFGSILFTND